MVRGRSIYCAHHHLQQERGYAILFVCLCVILWVRLSYWKSSPLISLKLGVIGPTNQKSPLTFGVAPVPDTDSTSLFHFHRHCSIADFRRFISIYRTVAARFLRNLGGMTDADDVNESTAFCKRSGRHPGKD